MSTPCDPMDCGPPGSSVHGILQARILEWIAIPVSRGSSRPRGLNPRLLHCRQFLYRLSYREDPLHSISIILQYKIKTKLKRKKLSSKLTISLHISTSNKNSVYDSHCYSCNISVVFLFYPLV